MTTLWVPTSACMHPATSLVGEFDPPELAVMCRDCGRAWDQDNVPGEVIDRLNEILESGAFKPRRSGYESR